MNPASDSLVEGIRELVRAIVREEVAVIRQAEKTEEDRYMTPQEAAECPPECEEEGAEAFIDDLLDNPPKDGDGYIYFVQRPTGGPVKIGFAADPFARLAGLQVGNPHELAIYGAIPNATKELEMKLHGLFWRNHVRGEWFNPCRHLHQLIAGAYVNTVARKP